MIIAKALKKQYGNQVAIEHVDIRVEPGSIVGFVGPNGAGKSTSLRIIAGLEVPDSGTCEIDGEPAGHLSSPWSQVGTLLDRQGVNGELTATRAIRAIGDAYGVPAKQAMEVLDIVDLTRAQNRKVRTFSLGMKQRLNLAIALVANPDYLILDETMNGLDPDGIMWLRDFFRRYRDEGGGILLSSHTLTEVEAVADEIIVIKGGRTVWAGGKSEMTTSSGSMISTNDNQRLMALLKKQGYEAVETAGFVSVSGIEPDVLGAGAFEAGLIVTHLTKDTANLEKLYLALNEKEGK